MRYLLSTTALLLALAAPAGADTLILDDPLHGQCAGCAETNVGGVPVTVLGPNGTSNFGFASSPPGGTGMLQLKFLIPDNLGLAAAQAFTTGAIITGANTGSGTQTGSLFSTTPWTSGFLETDYLHNTLANGAPKNPLDAWIDATKTVQAAADGYFVALFDVGNFTLSGPNTPFNAFGLTGASFFEGGLIAGNLFTLDGVISTAQSSALYNGSVPVPGPLVGAGLPGLLAGMFGLWGFFAKRRRHDMTA